MPPLTSENSHFLRSGPQEATLVMLKPTFENISKFHKKSGSRFYNFAKSGAKFYSRWKTGKGVGISRNLIDEYNHIYIYTQYIK